AHSLPSHSLPTRRSSDLCAGFSSSTLVLSTSSPLGILRRIFSISIEIPPSLESVTGCSCSVGLTFTSLILPFSAFLISSNRSLRSERHTSELQSRFDHVS